MNRQHTIGSSGMRSCRSHKRYIRHTVLPHIRHRYYRSTLSDTQSEEPRGRSRLNETRRTKWHPVVPPFESRYYRSAKSSRVLKQLSLTRGRPRSMGRSDRASKPHDLGFVRTVRTFTRFGPSDPDLTSHARGPNVLRKCRYASPVLPLNGTTAQHMPVLPLLIRATHAQVKR